MRQWISIKVTNCEFVGVGINVFGQLPEVAQMTDMIVILGKKQCSNQY